MKKKSCFILLAAVIMILSAIPVSAKTSIAPGVVIDQAKGSRDWDYGINIGLAGKTKWKSGTYSAELLLPVDLFVKNNNFNIEGQLDLRDPSIDDREEDPYMGTATSSSIEFIINSKGKLSIKRYSNMKDKYVSMGSASVTAEKVSTGKYYLVKIKDMPFDNTYFPKDVEWQPKNAKTIPTNKNLNYSVKFTINCGNKLNKAVKDCMYLVSFSCNTGVKTMKMNFTGNFQWFDAWANKAGKELPVTKKVANVKH